MASILRTLESFGLTAHDLLTQLLESNDDLCVRYIQRTSSGTGDPTHRLLDALLANTSTRSATEQWTKEAATQLAQHEVQHLTASESGLRFNAKTLSASDIATFDVEEYSQALSMHAPFLWAFCQTMLDANSFQRKRAELVNGAGFASTAAPPSGTASSLTDDDLMADLTAEDLADFPDQPRAETSGDQKSRAVARAAALRRSKSVAVISIFMQSSHYQCLKFAAFLGFNMQSRLTPEVVIEMYAHLGLSVAPSTLVNITTTLSNESQKDVIYMGDRMRMQMAYDNQDLGIHAAQPTIEKPGGFLNLASGTYLLVRHCQPADLAFSQYLWERSTLNPRRPLGLPPPYRLNYPDIVRLLPIAPTTVLDAHVNTFASGIRRILATQHPEFLWLRSSVESCPAGTEDWLRIPVEKTPQYPARTMSYNAGKNDDQWGILSTMLDGAGYRGETHSVLDKFCILVHGDLGMLEKITSLQSSRAIEETAYTRLQWVIGIPGLFHTRMACAEAVWRTHLKPGAGRSDDPFSIWHLACILRPRETGKLGSKPSFRLLHDVITHLTRALIFVCWERAISSRFSSLKEFAQSRPSWDEIIALSEQIAQQYVAGENFSSTRRRAESLRDQIGEDISLFLREGLLYDDLGHSTTFGHIGRVEKNLAEWIPILAAVGKHKYATALARFFTALEHVYPAQMSRAIRLNWLCNPTGRADGFRAVDWLVELNNMMQKTWYGGEGSHRTLEHLKRQSVLTELYRNCVSQLEKNFHLTHRTVRHHPPDMTKTLAVVTGHIRSYELLASVPGRKSRLQVPDQVVAGFAKLQRQYSTLRRTADDEEDEEEDTADDSRDTEPDDGDLELELELEL